MSEGKREWRKTDALWPTWKFVEPGVARAAGAAARVERLVPLTEWQWKTVSGRDGVEASRDEAMKAAEADLKAYEASHGGI